MRVLPPRLHRLVKGLLAGLLVAASLVGHAQGPPLPLDSLETLAREGRAQVTALVVDLDNNRLLAALSPDTRLSPASVTKLYTAAAALRQFGPDHRFVTRLMSRGDIVDGVLLGDLVLAGSGDPGLSTAQLWTLVTRLRDQGVERIGGRVVINESLFGSVPCSIVDRCQAQQSSDHAYDSPLSAAGVNYSTLEVEIRPSNRPGEAATTSLLPPGLRGYDLDGAIQTGRPGSRGLYRVLRETEDGQSTLRLSGSLPAGTGPYRLQRSVAYPNRYTARLLEALLIDAGIAVSGKRAIRSSTLPADIRELVSVESPALAAQVRDLLGYSNNFIADVLTLDLAAYAGASPPLTLPRAAQTLQTLARTANIQPRGWNENASRPSGPLIMDSGSGLSTSNRLSARDLVALLAFMYEQPADFPAFLGGMPVPRHTTGRMLKYGSEDWRNRLMAKTGTLTEPVNVRSLSGYLRLQDGGWGAFAVIVNSVAGSQAVSLADALEAIRTDLERLLERY